MPARMLLLFATSLLAIPIRAQTYDLRAVPQFGSTQVRFIVDFNEERSIGGYAFGARKLYECFRFRDGVFEYLSGPAQSRYDFFGGMNNFGTTVGTAHFVDSRTAFRTDTVSELLAGVSAAADVNDDGAIVGFHDENGGTTRAVLFSNGASRDLGWGDGSMAVSINDSGRIAGVRTDSGSPRRGVIGAAGESVDIPMPASYTFYSIRKISANGTVIGAATDTAGRRHAFASDGIRTTFPFLALNDMAADINSLGEIVGRRNDGEITPLLYRDSMAIDLRSLIHIDGNLFVPLAVNDYGEIALDVWDSSETPQHRLFIATPRYSAEEKVRRLTTILELLPAHRSFRAAAGALLSNSSRAFARGDTAAGCRSMQKFLDDIAPALASQRITAGNARKVTLLATDVRSTANCGTR